MAPQAADDLACTTLRARVQRCIDLDKELLVQPELFLALAPGLPDLADVRVDMKRGDHHRCGAA